MAIVIKCLQNYEYHCYSFAKNPYVTEKYLTSYLHPTHSNYIESLGLVHAMITGQCHYTWLYSRISHALISTTLFPFLSSVIWRFSRDLKDKNRRHRLSYLIDHFGQLHTEYLEQHSQSQGWIRTVYPLSPQCCDSAHYLHIIRSLNRHLWHPNAFVAVEFRHTTTRTPSGTDVRWLLRHKRVLLMVRWT